MAIEEVKNLSNEQKNPKSILVAHGILSSNLSNNNNDIEMKDKNDDDLDNFLIIQKVLRSSKVNQQRKCCHVFTI